MAAGAARRHAVCFSTYVWLLLAAELSHSITVRAKSCGIWLQTENKPGKLGPWRVEITS